MSVRFAAATVAAAGVPVAVAAAFIPVRTDVPSSTIALVLAVVVALAGAAGGRLDGAVAAVAGGIAFDFFDTRPYGSLAISRSADLEAVVLLVAVGLVVGQLAARNRHHRTRAEDTSYDLGRVHGVAEMVATGAPVDQVVLAVANELTDLLGLRTCRYDENFASRPGPFVERNGGIAWGAVRWGFATTGLPSKEISLTVEHQGLPLGRYVLVPEPGTRVTADQLLTAVALADQAGAALAAQRHPQA